MHCGSTDGGALWGWQAVIADYLLSEALLRASRGKGELSTLHGTAPPQTIYFRGACKQLQSRRAAPAFSPRPTEAQYKSPFTHVMQ